LWHWDAATSERVLLAEAYLMQRSAVTEWTEFTIPFTYVNTTDVPDTMAMVFSSSAGGGSFKGNEGSVLLVDDMQLGYEATSVGDAHTAYVDAWTITTYADHVIVEASTVDMGSVVVCDVTGRIVASVSEPTMNRVILGPLPPALYIVRVDASAAHDVVSATRLIPVAP
jgi:hypothetical protein